MCWNIFYIFQSDPVPKIKESLIYSELPLAEHSVISHSYQITHRQLQTTTLAQSRKGSKHQKATRSRQQTVHLPLRAARPCTQLHTVDSALEDNLILDDKGSSTCTQKPPFVQLAIRKHIQPGSRRSELEDLFSRD